MEGLTHLWLPTVLHHPLHPLLIANPLMQATHDITVVKMLLKIHQC